MLVIKPKTQGAGIVDVLAKVANSALAKKVINSSISKKVLEHATKENFQKAANSAIGKQLTKAVVSGVANASEKAANSTLKHFGVTAEPGLVSNAIQQAANKELTKYYQPPPKVAISTNAKKGIAKYNYMRTLPSAPRKRAHSPSKPGRKKKRRRTNSGRGIILE